MIDIARLVQPADDFESAFPGLGFSNRFAVQTTGEPILVCDPIYLADVYNSKDKIATFVRQHGAFLMDFGGDASCPVWWKRPFALFPLSIHLSEEDLVPAGAELWVERIATDSGSFVFLPMAETLPPELNSAIQSLIEEKNAAQLPVPAGRWELFYEQFDPPRENEIGLYRNIVLKHTGDS